MQYINWNIHLKVTSPRYIPGLLNPSSYKNEFTPKAVTDYSITCQKTLFGIKVLQIPHRHWLSFHLRISNLKLYSDFVYLHSEGIRTQITDL